MTAFSSGAVYAPYSSANGGSIMQTAKRRGSVRRGGIVYLSPEDIETGIIQREESPDDEGIRELADSIAQYGIINPLTVRLRDERYELIAGERRLRAARLLGLRDVPCTLLDVTLEEASLIALVENLRRRELGFIAEARGIQRLIELFGMNQEEAARRLGSPQSDVDGRLSLLSLPPEVLDGLGPAGLTEAHGRALLRLPDANTRRAAFTYISAQGLSVGDTEAYADSLLSQSGARRVFVMKDLRLFLNTVTHGLELMRQSGIDASLSREDSGDKLILHIVIPKKSE